MPIVIVRDVLIAVTCRKGMHIELMTVYLLRRWLSFSASLGREELSDGVGFLASAAVREVGVDCLADFAVLEGGGSLQDGAEQVRFNCKFIS